MFNKKPGVTTIISIALIGYAISYPPVHAELQGSTALLDHIEKQAQRPLGNEKSNVAKLYEDLQSFAFNMESQSADANGEEWARLFLDVMNLGQMNVSDQLLTYDARTGQQFSVNSVLSQLPSPHSWPVIVDRLESVADRMNSDQVQKYGLMLLAAALRGNNQHTLKIVQEIKSNFTDGGQSMGLYGKNSLSSIELAVMKRDGSPEGIIEILKASMATMTEWSPELEIPDLVTLIGVEITDQFIRYALKFPAVQLSVPGGGETLAIAKNIVIEEIASLKAPQWALTQDMDSIELYEALEKRFGIPPDAVSGGAIDQDILKLMQASSSGSSGVIGSDPHNLLY